MANEAMDYIGYCVLNPGAGAAPANQVFIPSVQGSRYREDPRLEGLNAAIGVPEDVLFTQGVTIPSLVVRAPVIGGSGSFLDVGTNKLNNAVTPNASTALVPASEWVSGAGLGPLQWKFADETTGASGTASQWSKSKLNRLRIEWSEDGPLMATYQFLMFGLKSASPTAPAGTGPAFTNMPTGLVLMSQGVDYGPSTPTFDGVLGGAIDIDLRLRPEISTPMAVDSTTGVAYPVNYWNSEPPLVTLELTQKKGTSYTQDGADNAILSGMTVRFKDYTGTPKITFTMSGFKPITEKPQQRGLAAIRRTYNNQRAAIGSASYAFS